MNEHEIRLEQLRVYERPDEIPVLPGPVPVPLRALHQIEVTSMCNLRCRYCPNPKMKRPKGHMSMADFERAMDWVRFYVRKGTQVDINLAGTGESTLHPDFVEMVALARYVMGEHNNVIFATNGVGYDESLVRAVKPYRPLVWVSLHRPEKAAAALHWWKNHGLFAGMSHDPVTNSNNWAGQVDWPHTQRYATACMWMRYGMAMVLSNGQITSCCLDAEGAGVLGHVSDPIDSVKNRPYGLCKPCHQHIRVMDQEGNVL